MPPRAKDSTKGMSPQERWRNKIRTSALITRLEKIAEGKVDATAHQVTAALGLLRKTLADQTESTVQHSGGITVNILNISGNQPPK